MSAPTEPEKTGQDVLAIMKEQDPAIGSGYPLSNPNPGLSAQQSSFEPSDDIINFLHAYEGQGQTEDQLLTVRNLGDGVLTVGFGSSSKRWPDLKLGDKITMEQAKEMFQSDLAWAVKKAQKLTNGRKDITQNKFDALVSFIYNTGGNQSPKAMKALERGDLDAFAFEAMSPEAGVVNDEGKKNDGLINRRQDELAIWEGTAGAYKTINRDTNFGGKWKEKRGIK